MVKRAVRPWDSTGIASLGQNAKKQQHWRNEMAFAKSVLEAPSVKVDGIKYLSDRFYLNWVDGDDTPTTHTATRPTHDCICGSQNPPPLFSRERLLNSLDLKAAILGTFTLDLEWTAEAFPQLVGPKSTVPTFILHGDKKIRNWLKDTTATSPKKHGADEISSFLPDSEEFENSLSTIAASISATTPSGMLMSPISEREYAGDQENIKAQTILGQVQVGSIDLPRLSANLCPTKSNNYACMESSDMSHTDGTVSSLKTQADSVPVPVSELVGTITGEQFHQSLSPLRFKRSAASSNASPLKMEQPRSIFQSISQENEFSSNRAFELGKQCFLTQVLSAWKPTPDTKVSKEKSNTKSSKGNKSSTALNREWKRGVHHPKFMLLFEKNGNLVVVVSTANLTRSRTIEGTWVQRFMPNRRRYRTDRPRSPSEFSVSTFKSTDTMSSSFTCKRSRRGNGSIDATANDFGPVLQDFLSKLSEASVVQDQQEKTLEHFMTEHLQIDLATFAESFHFEKAQVHLVPVVPGNWKPGSFNISGKKKLKVKTSPKKTSLFSYGRQRVQQILQKETIIQSTKDRLILQPTSFGGNWKRGEMAHLVRSYLNYNESDPDCWDDEALLERMDIIWPSMNFLDSNQNLLRRKSIGNGLSEEMPFNTKDLMRRPSEKSIDSQEGLVKESSFVFMSSNTFNTCDRSCLSRMARFESSNPPQYSHFLVPHFKSVARLLTSSTAALRKYDFLSTRTAQEYLSWFLLTSACLSHGAQGKQSTHIDGASPVSSTISSEVQYANFELGILFTSRIQSKEKRLYGFRPHQCSCQSAHCNETSTLLKMIHLPIPYSLRPNSYFGHEDDSVMQETPFFHQIDAGTRCVGNMLLTPYGVRQVERGKDEAKSYTKKSSRSNNSDKKERLNTNI